MKNVYGRVSYEFATSFIQNKILLNNIPELDENIWENIPSVYNEEEDDYEYPEIYQWYLTDLSDSEAEWLQETFELMLVYSDKLGWVLCVDHFGTAWDGVGCDVYSQSFWEGRGKENEFKY